MSPRYTVQTFKRANLQKRGAFNGPEGFNIALRKKIAGWGPRKRRLSALFPLAPEGQIPASAMRKCPLASRSLGQRRARAEGRGELLL